jgi:hypothetical protein
MVADGAAQLHVVDGPSVLASEKRSMTSAGTPHSGQARRISTGLASLRGQLGRLGAAAAAGGEVICHDRRDDGCDGCENEELELPAL